MFEEVKEMIDSTIYTNGNGEVTAKNLNLAMQAIVDATEGKLVTLEENGLGNSVAYINVPYDGEELTKEQIAENVVALGKVIKGDAALALKGKYSDNMSFAVSYPNAYVVFGDGVVAVYDTYHYTTTGGGVMENAALQMFFYFLNLDGTVEVLSFEEKPASNGPLTIWLNEVMYGGSDEMKAENAETYKVLVSGEKVSLSGRVEYEGDGYTDSRSYNLNYAVAVEGGETGVIIWYNEIGGGTPMCILSYDGTLEVIE